MASRQGLRKAVAAVLAVAVVLTVMLSILLASARGLMLDEARVAAVLTTSLTRSGLLTDALVSQIRAGQGVREKWFSSLSADDWKNIVRILAPASWQEQQLRALVDQVYRGLASPEGVAALSISLETPRQALAGAGASRVAEIIIRSWPACSAAQLAQLSSGAAPDPSSIACQPPDPLFGQMRQVIAAQVSSFSQQMPGSLPIGLDGADAAARFTGLRSLLLMLRVGLWAAALASLAFLLITVALGAASARSALRWASLPMCAGALADMLASTVVLFARSRIISGLAKVPQPPREGLLAAGRALLAAVMLRAIWIGVGLLALGLVLLAISFLVPRPGPRPSVASSNAASQSATPTREAGWAGMHGEQPGAGAAAGPESKKGPATLPGAPGEGGGPKGIFG